MSSIYRKGRDGYFYYQTYVFNKNSGKKNKRIFHSLNTKDIEEATKKKNILDKRYEKQNFLGTNPVKLKNNFILKPNFQIIAGTIILIIFLSRYFIPNPEISKTIKQTLPRKVENIDIATPGLYEPSIAIDSQQSDSINQRFKGVIKNNSHQKQDLIHLTIPDYNVERVNILSTAFNQGKVYVTINKNTSKESQRLLCEKIAEKYSQFSNIVVCLYANNRAGKNLALGNDEIISIEDQKRFWLAMYTYNSVEGEYFDDNPSRYLTIY